MISRTQATLAGACLSLWMTWGAAAADAVDPEASGAAHAAQGQAGDALSERLEEAVPAEPSETEAAPAPPAEPAPGAGDEPHESGEGAGSGLFSRIVEWFRGDSAPPPAPPPADDAEAAGEPVTLGQVHQAMRDMIAEVEVLRAATGVSAAPREAEPREGLAPVHVYVKTLEVLEKTARVQRRLGMIPVETRRAPLTATAPEDLHRAVRAIVGELHRIKRQLVVEEAIDPAPVAGAATPSALYRELAHASYLLDGLVGRPATLNDVLARVVRVHDEMRPIAARLEATLGAEARATTSPRAPREVAQQILRATFKAISLQSALGMEASDVPTMALAQAGAAEALDAANILLAEIVRIRAHLGVAPPEERGESAEEPEADVFAQALLAVAHLDAMIRAAGNAP